jgi:hypothetical protein
MPKTKLYFSYVLLNFHQKILDILKNEEIFSKMIFL